MIALQADGPHTYYGKSHILHGVGLAVEEGQITALLGRNGAGKTTTMRSLMGLTPARQGKIEIFGQDTTRWPPYRIAQLGVGYVPEGRRVFANLTVAEESPECPPRAAGHGPRSGCTSCSRGFTSGAAIAAGNCPGGEQEMLAIGRALILNPRLLILDEPSQGLAPLIVREVFDVVTRMRSEGISVLLVGLETCMMSLEIADQAYVLDDGAVVYAGSAAEVARRRGARPGTRRRQRRNVVARGRAGLSPADLYYTFKAGGQDERQAVQIFGPKKKAP